MLGLSPQSQPTQPPNSRPRPNCNNSGKPDVCSQFCLSTPERDCVEACSKNKNSKQTTHKQTQISTKHGKDAQQAQINKHIHMWQPQNAKSEVWEKKEVCVCVCVCVCEQISKTQDEPQWIVAQRLLSALTIPGFK